MGEKNKDISEMSESSFSPNMLGAFIFIAYGVTMWFNGEAQIMKELSEYKTIGQAKVSVLFSILLTSVWISVLFAARKG